MTKTSYSSWIIFKIVILCTIHHNLVNATTAVFELEPGSFKHVLPEVGRFGYTVERMNIYCYNGREKDLTGFLQSIIIHVDIEDNDFKYFTGSTVEEVEQAHLSEKSIFSFNVFSRSKRVLKLNPFNNTCIGLETASEYTISLSLLKLDLSKFAMLVGGIIVFLFAGKLSKQSLFFYCGGICVGNVASIMVLVYFISKLFPRKPLMYGVLATGWTLTAYFIQILVDNVQSILVTYRKYVALYILTTSILAFALCYYKGPPKNVRSINLIKWGLQAVGLLSIFFSSDLREATLCIIAACVLIYYFPFDVVGFFRRLWRKKFPPKRKLLTRDEFEEQGRLETEKALKELREFVKSPKCKDQWKLVMNLSQPTRFASFVEGENHLTQNETMDYDDAMLTMDLSDDDDSDTDSDVSEAIDESPASDEKFKQIDKKNIRKHVNGNSSRYRSPNRSAQISSSTPNTFRGRSERARKTLNSYIELSDDDE